MRKQYSIVLKGCRLLNRGRPREKERPMIIEFTLIAALAVSGIIGAVVVTARDGYRRIPTRRA
jgi:hypothetical protein